MENDEKQRKNQQNRRMAAKAAKIEMRKIDGGKYDFAIKLPIRECATNTRSCSSFISATDKRMKRIVYLFAFFRF